MPAFSKAAGCRAEPYGLNRRSRRKKCSGRGARCEADSPGSGRGGTALAPSTSKTPGRGGTPRGGHPSPLFLKYGKAGAAVSAAASVGPERCPPGTRTPCNPGRSWGFTPNPTTFEKVDETFTCLHPTCVEGPALAERKKAACPVRSRTPSAGFWASVSQKTPPL